MRSRVLVVDDDRDTCSFLAQGLREEGYVVQIARDGREALYLATEKAPDLLVLDRMLPGLDGLAVIRALRAADSPVRVLLLSAMSSVEDRVAGLQAGADDYLCKPFSFIELLARIQALLRRSTPTRAPKVRLSCADLDLDLLRRKVMRGDRQLELQPREFQILEVLMQNKERLVTRTMLLETVWGLRFDPNTNVIDVHMHRLRQKVDKGFDRRLIHTIRNSGYMLSEQR
jgi:two-component system OmpR family response regulator